VIKFMIWRSTCNLFVLWAQKMTCANSRNSIIVVPPTAYLCCMGSERYLRKLKEFLHWPSRYSPSVLNIGSKLDSRQPIIFWHWSNGLQCKYAEYRSKILLAPSDDFHVLALNSYHLYGISSPFFTSYNNCVYWCSS